MRDIKIDFEYLQKLLPYLLNTIWFGNKNCFQGKITIVNSIEYPVNQLKIKVRLEQNERM